MDWTLLHKYLTGESTPSEQDEVKQWIQAQEKNKKFFHSLCKIWSVEPDDNIDVDAREAWESLYEELVAEEKARPGHEFQGAIDNAPQVNEPKRKGYGRTFATSVAAAAIAVVATLIYIFMPGDFINNNEVTLKASQVQEVSTHRGQRTSFRLSDGTHVFLNTASRIKIAPQFGDSIRSVYLEGEAYFDVARNLQVPFVVKSGDAYTKVLGTKFGVKAYPQDKEIQVVVEEGEVLLGSSTEDPEETKRLTKNTLGLLASDGDASVLSLDDIGKYLAWKEGRLVFESTPFKDVIPRLERWYDIKIEADSSLISQKVTASFDDEPMLEVLNVLAVSLDAGLKREDRKISFNSK